MDTVKAVKILLFTALCLAFIGCGINGSSLGTTLVHMGCIFNANTQQMSYAFLAQNSGYMAGALLSGLLFMCCGDAAIQFGVATAGLGAYIVLTPWAPDIYTYCVFVAVANVFYAYLISCGSSYIISQWPAYKGPLLQTLFTMKCLGRFIFPSVAIPFLADISQNGGKIQRIARAAAFSVSEDMNFLTNGSSSGKCEVDEVERVRYPYVICGVPVVCVSLLFFAAFIILKSSPSTVDNKIDTHSEYESFEDSPEQSTRGRNILKISLILLTILCTLFLFFYNFVFANFLPTFAIKGLKFPAPNAALLTSVHYAGQFLGLVIAIFLSVITTSTKMIVINTFTVSLTYIALLFCESNSWIIWVGSAATGFFTSSTFPSLMLWISDYVEMTSVLSAVLIFTTNVAEINGNLTLGYLLQNYTHMSLVYFTVTVSCVTFLVFSLMLLLVFLCRNRTDSEIKRLERCKLEQ